MRSLAALLALSISIFSYGQQTNESMDVGGVTRTYVQYLPTGFNPATESLPVVFCLHGIGDVATNIANIGFNQIADTARFIAVYPQGLPNGSSQNSWNNGTIFLSSNADDLSFINQLIDTMALNYNANQYRIYASGFSMGSIMCHKLACELNDRIAAIGAMSGPMSTQDLNNCNPTYPTPVMHIHGTADGTVPYDSGALPSLSLVPATMDFWKGVHTCANTADSTQLPNTASDGLTVDRFVYQGCSPNGSVELWRVNGGDHNYFYEPVNDFTEADEIWRFFYRWSHPNPTWVGLDDLANNQFKVYPVPSEKGNCTIESPVNGSAGIYSLNGQLITSVQLQKGENKVEFNLDAGVYFVKVDGHPQLQERIVVQ